MFTASMIEYQIDEEKKIITASVSGVEYDAIDTMKKAFRQNNLILEDTATYVEMIPDEDGKYCDENISLVDERISTCKKYRLPNTFSATAKYDPNDPHPYSIERGKMIARRRLYNQYNRAYATAINNLQSAIIDTNNKMMDALLLARDRQVNFQYFEYYDVFKRNCECSEKL